MEAEVIKTKGRSESHFGEDVSDVDGARKETIGNGEIEMSPEEIMSNRIIDSVASSI